MDVRLCSCKKCVKVYIDDIAVLSSSWAEHLHHLRKVFKILRKANLKAKPTKCKLAMPTCSYLGHVVGNGRVEMEEAKTEAVRNFCRPKTKKDVRAFLGLAGYYRRFIPNFSTLSADLSDLTKKEMPNKVVWSEDCERSFNQLKEEVASRPASATMS